MNQRAGVTVKVPMLNGGVNEYDIAGEVADNQLTACENVWWYKGALRTRPGMRLLQQGPTGKKQMINEREMLIADSDDGQLIVHHVDVAEGVRRIGPGGSDTIYGTPTVMGFRAPNDAEEKWYFLVSSGRVLQGSTEEDTALEDAEPYIPTVLINGYGDEGDKDYSAPAGDLYQDYNMLTNVYKATYSTDGISTRFRLPEPCAEEIDIVDGMINYGHIRIKMADGSEQTANFLKTKTTSSPIAYADFFDVTKEQIGRTSVMGIVMRGELDTNTGMLQLVLDIEEPEQDGEGTTWRQSVALPRICSNNIEVTVARSRYYAEEEKDIICSMTRCTWYGGTRSGLSGGTRLFVCGNPDQPNLLHWSGIEHPLYFPEHNYCRVGDASQAITAFGKQGELLILFKEHQMYALQYNSGSEEDYAFAEAGGVPLTTYMAQFPVTPIHDTVGCDCPDTVRLVNNRLVWANSDGHVHLLTAVNQFSERNVRDISRNVAADMAAQGEALKTAVAGEYEGYYILVAGQRAYLLDTQNSAFASFNYYSSEDTARKALPWYIWQLPAVVYGMVSDGYRALLAPPDGAQGIFELAGDTDFGMPISGYFATKTFDFGVADRTKSVGQLYLGVDMAPEGRLAVTYVTEKGTYRDPYELEGGELAAFGHNGCIRQMRLTPHMHLVQSFGLRADITAGVAVDGITIKVRQQGAVR